MMRTILAALSIWALVGSALLADETDAPNVIFLLTDDQCTLSMGCYGNDEVRTPNMDRLAAQGVTFERHYVTTSICMASRANIMTGLYEYRTGCNFGAGKLSAEHWAASYPQRFRSAGYLTGFAGKFGFEVDGMKQLPARDFDFWGGSPGQSSFQTKQNHSMEKYADEFPHSSTSYGAFGRDVIRQAVAEDKPFCLSISFKAPHRPVEPDPQFDDVYAGATFTRPENYGRDSGAHFSEQSRQGRQYPRFEEWGYRDDYDAVMQKYNQQVYGVDVAVGMILDEIESQEIADNTIIIFTSDNGFMCGSHGYGSKVLPYEESSGVPLIIFDPRFPATHGQRCRSLTGSIDLAPTMLDLAGLEQVEGVDGVSLKPLLEDPAATVREELYLMNFWGPLPTHSFAVVTDRWKYIYWYSEKAGMLATEELFDMQGDRVEMHNLSDASEHQEDVAGMRARYDSAVQRIEQTAASDRYRKYGVLFDRNQPWTQKKKLLPSGARR